jgi:hypothetical protein
VPLVDAVARSGTAPLSQLRAVLSASGDALGLRPLLDVDADTRRDQAVAIAAIVPSVLYYLALFIQADLEAAKGNKSKYPGRQPTAMRQRDKIKQLDGQGLSRVAIAAALGISERSVYRAIAE